MTWSLLALAFSILSFGLLFVSGWYEFRKKTLNIAPYLSILLASFFYGFADSTLDVSFLIVVWAGTGVIHLLLILNERK